ncbi:helix-turn-helix domain-containing protein [Enterobacter wuhouensis]|uniref:Helix-turn-helix domain-containing protein n=1 Tax=Enterobacter wuhouensis TaxID=2529381 RepID=A0ABZ1DQ78_9ENTR|nr:helix-turn-helix domain-containing protein [Enterobacter wuhouensis]WRW33888.1 helix-turn-helix domain-containing protein [Enterobacter wuhouensis]
MTARELANAIDITDANLSILKNGHARAIRFSTLDKICTALQCTPGELIKYTEQD